MKNIKIGPAVIIAIIIGAIGFYGGTVYQKSKQATFGMRNFQGVMNGRNGERITSTQGGREMMMRRGQNGGMTVGEVTAIDNETMTIKTIDGGSKIVILNSQTKYTKAAEGTSSDLKQGDMVAVSGTGNNDGSVTATNVQLNPGFKVDPLPTTAP